VISKVVDPPNRERIRSSNNPIVAALPVPARKEIKRAGAFSNVSVSQKKGFVTSERPLAASRKML
jgi:hypothetical protein